MRIALISMPFTSINRPSIQLGLLSSIVRKHDFYVDTFHLNLDFAKEVGIQSYQELAAVNGGLLYGEWIFSKAAFQDQLPKCNKEFLNHFESRICRELSILENPVTILEKLQNETVPFFLDQLMNKVDWDKYSVIGFTSTFQQTLPSIALARKIKEKYPNKIIICGGANFDGKMGIELTKKIDVIDYAVIGEGDKTFPEFLKAIERGDNPLSISGVYGKDKPQVEFDKEEKVLVDISESPIPDFVEYFKRIKKLNLSDEMPNISLPIESSRGCWWGEKHHCTFCGLNGSTMTYRSKSPEDVFNELISQSQKYEVFDFFCVDNIINMKYTRTLLPKLKELDSNLTVFYETKANLTRSQLQLFFESGVNEIQPGIESLSTPVLKLMQKGVTSIQNVNLLRWCKYYGIEVTWSILRGFPNEKEEYYIAQNKLISKIYHLEPPLSCPKIRMDRFSPIFFDRQKFPTKFARPAIIYKYIYPDCIDLENVAYFFDHEFENHLEENCYDELKINVVAWTKDWENQDKSDLSYQYVPNLVKIEDRRTNYEHKIYTIKGLPAEVYNLCSEKQKRPKSIAKELSDSLSLEDIYDMLDEFCGLDLMIQEDGFYLSLAIPKSKYTYNGQV